MVKIFPSKLRKKRVHGDVEDAVQYAELRTVNSLRMSFQYFGTGCVFLSLMKEFWRGHGSNLKFFFLFGRHLGVKLQPWI